MKDFFLATSMLNLTLVEGYLFSWEDGREKEDQFWKICYDQIQCSKFSWQFHVA